MRKVVRFKLYLKKSPQDLVMALMCVVSKIEVTYDSNLVLCVKMLLSSYIGILTPSTLGVVVWRPRVNAGVVS